MKTKLKNFSVTSVKTALDCPRKFAFNWLMGQKAPQTPAQQRGDEVHKSAECFINGRLPGGLSTFTPPPEHRLYIQALSPFFPGPEEEALVEHWMRMPTNFGIGFVGKIDLIRYQTDPPKLYDWKTAADLRYMLTPDEVQKDIQTNVYAEYLFREGLRGPIEGGLVYVHTPKKPLKTKAKVVPVLRKFTPTDTIKIWNEIQPTMERMLEISLLDHPNDVSIDEVKKKNYAPCTMYGGCPFSGQCEKPMFATINTKKHTPDKRKEASVSFSDRLKNKMNGQSAAPAPAAPAPAPVKTAAAPAPAPAKTVAAPAPAPSAAKPTFAERMAAQKAAKAAAAEAAPAPTGIVPPDAPPRDSGGAQPMPQDAEAEVVEVAAEAAGDVTPDKKRGRGRPKGSVSPAQKGFVIYVDCLPTKGSGDVTLAEDWFGPIEMKLNEVAAEEGKPHWMMLEFAPQKAAIGVFVKERIDSGGLPPTMLVRSSSGMFMRDVLPLLKPHATEIFESFQQQ